jgi:DNA-binding NtrC family response regulator
VGKLTLLRAAHQRRDPSGRFSVLDATEAASQDWLVRVRHALLDGEGDLVIRHIDRLTARQAHFLASVLQEMRAAGQPETRRVAVTRISGSGAPANLAELLRSFPRSVALPPLRHHVEDLPELVRFFMGKLSPHGRLTCSPEAMQLLARSTWPGNAEQLWQVMRSIVARKRVGSIEPGDLPPECWTVSRRRLSQLEALERDAIVQSLLDSGGNKAKAAESLGMSRATIYRKIHGYGIVIPAR